MWLGNKHKRWSKTKTFNGRPDTTTQNTAQLEGETQETQEEESNIIRGNRIGSRFTRNLVEDEEFEIVVNPKTGTSYWGDGINFGLLHEKIVLYHHYPQQLL